MSRTVDEERNKRSQTTSTQRADQQKAGGERIRRAISPLVRHKHARAVAIAACIIVTLIGIIAVNAGEQSEENLQTRPNPTIAPTRYVPQILSGFWAEVESAAAWVYVSGGSETTSPTMLASFASERVGQFHAVLTINGQQFTNGEARGESYTVTGPAIYGHHSQIKVTSINMAAGMQILLTCGKGQDTRRNHRLRLPDVLGLRAEASELGNGERDTAAEDKLSKHSGIESTTHSDASAGDREVLDDRADDGPNCHRKDQTNGLRGVPQRSADRKPSDIQRGRRQHNNQSGMGQRRRAVRHLGTADRSSRERKTPKTCLCFRRADR